MRVEQSFTVGRPPGEVFAYMINPANLASWQPSKVSVEPLTDEPPRKGYRIRERTKIGPRQWDQVIEFSEFEPGRALSTHIVEGSMPVDGRWTMQARDDDGTNVQFVAQGQLTGPMRLLEPLVRRGIARNFRRYHALLARNVETAAARPEEPHSMTSTKTDTSVLQAFLDAFNAHDVDAIMSFFAEDCVLDMPRGPGPGGRRLVGREQVREAIESRLDGIPDVHYGDDRHWICGDRAVSEWTLRGTWRTGESVAVRGCDLFEFVDGKISRKDSFWKILD